MYRPPVLIATVLIAALAFAATATAAPLAPYDGANPFRCVTQDTGLGVAFPDPSADPFCVRYDKTQQNVTELGLVDFLLNEPARVAAAVPKCFYHQSDHWTGSVVQGGSELWNWQGRYFFDKARGIAGAYMEDLRLGAVPIDPRTVLPPELWAYFSSSGGGMYTDSVASVPECAERVDTTQEIARVYRPGWRYPAG